MSAQRFICLYLGYFRLITESTKAIHENSSRKEFMKEGFWIEARIKQVNLSTILIIIKYCNLVFSI